MVTVPDQEGVDRMLECSKCGSSNAVGSNFCSKCGNALSSAQAVNDTTRVLLIPEEDARTLEISAEDADVLSKLPAGHAMLIVTRGPDVGARYLLEKPVVTVGRSTRSDIFLDDITVSRHHAEFSLSDGVISLVDKGSLNGSYVNRTLVDNSAVLRPGDEVQIGKFRMLFFVSEHGMK